MATPEQQAKMIKDILMGAEFQTVLAMTIASKVSEDLRIPLEKISLLEDESKVHKHKIGDLERTVARLEQKVSNMRTDIVKSEYKSKTQNLMSQSGKDKNLVITGVIENDKPPKELVNELFGKLKLTPDMEFSVERLGAARVETNQQTGWFSRQTTGVTNNQAYTRPRPLIVKFNNMWDRRKVYANRLGLRHVENARSIFINEDLTKQTAEMFYTARQLRKRNIIKSAWTEGGVLNIRKNNGTVKTILGIGELTEQEIQEPNFHPASSTSSFHSTDEFNRLGECKAVQGLRAQHTSSATETATDNS